MSKRPRRNHTATFKAKVALAAIQGEKTVSELRADGAGLRLSGGGGGLFSRRILAWRLSITMETEFCIEAVEEALTKFVRPEIFNTDQGSQFRAPGDRSSSLGWSSLPKPSPSS